MSESPNPNDDFAAAMRAAEARSGEGEQESTDDDSAASALGAVAPPAAPPPVEDDDQGTAPAGEGSAEDDRLTQLETQLKEAQSMIGRQANEIGELRKQPEPQAEDDFIESTGFVSQESWDNIEQTFEDKGGAGLMLNVSHTAPELIDAALAYWKAQGDPEAFLYEQELLKTEAQLAKQAQPEETPNEDVQTLLRRDAQRSAEGQLLQEFGKERLEEIVPLMKEGLGKFPESVKNALGQDLNSNDPEKIVGAFRTVASLIPGGTGGEAAKLAADQAEAAKRATKQAAAVNTGSQGGGAQGESALPTSPEDLAALDADERRKAASAIMRDRILGNTTSVQAELAKNKEASKA